MGKGERLASGDERGLRSGLRSGETWDGGLAGWRKDPSWKGCDGSPLPVGETRSCESKSDAVPPPYIGSEAKACGESELLKLEGAAHSPSEGESPGRRNPLPSTSSVTIGGRVGTAIGGRVRPGSPGEKQVLSLGAG